VLGSIKDTDELKAAKDTRIKNKADAKELKGIPKKAMGSVSKNSDGPAVGVSSGLAKTIGKIIIPAIIATKVSRKIIKLTVLVKFCSSGMYAPYAIIAPMPKLRVKNACPIAAIITLEEILEKSGIKRKLIAFSISPVNDE